MGKVKAYITAASQISCQQPFCAAEGFAAMEAGSRFEPCKDPDFKQYISPMEARRMSSILKRSIAVSKNVTSASAIASPDAIITGTGLGCVSDTESFLLKMLNDGEQMLNPSKFISSTPNTIGSQMAILLDCKGFNSTHVNDWFAFEGALLDSLMQIEFGKASNVLLCSADQTTDFLYGFLQRMWPNLPVSEGAVAFMLENQPKPGSWACVEDMCLPRKHHSLELDRMLKRNHIGWDDIDVAVTSGFPDVEDDKFSFIQESLPRMTYSQYSGVYLSASAFGMYMCADMLRKSGKPQRILLAGYNRGAYSFVLLSGLCTN